MNFLICGIVVAFIFYFRALWFKKQSRKNLRQEEQSDLSFTSSSNVSDFSTSSSDSSAEWSGDGGEFSGGGSSGDFESSDSSDSGSDSGSDSSSDD